jgi:formiminotetrahydrofolate cyclodeaminase
MTTECFGNDIKAMKVPKMTEEEKEEFLVEVRNAYWLL